MPNDIPSLLTCTLSDIAEGLDKGSFSSVDLVKAYLARIEEVDDEFRSVIEVNTDAVKIARQLDEERKALGRRGSLHGVPLPLKDNIVTLDSMEATYGSYALVGAKPAQESAVVTALRDAGAIILGKANLAEIVGFRSTSGCTGWSARGGQARGIFYPGMKASGSSTGSAISTALGLAFASLGTELLFSIVSPAERSGIVGFKPTRELIPSEGIIYASHKQDTIGLLTRTVQDSAMVLGGIINHMNKKALRQCHLHNDPLSLRQISSLGTNLSGIRIGLLLGTGGLLSEIRNVPDCRLKAFNRSVRLLREAGAIVVLDVDIPGAKEYQKIPQSAKYLLLDTELKIATNTYLSTLNYDKEEYPQRNVAVLERAQKTDPEDELYKTTLAMDAYFISGEGSLPSAMAQRTDLDVLLVPMLSFTMQALAAKVGSPVVSIPMVAPGIPFSLYMYGKPQGDLNLLRVGHVFEQLTRVREQLRPYKLPSKTLSTLFPMSQIAR